jgi:hypothetical protein
VDRIADYQRRLAVAELLALPDPPELQRGHRQTQGRKPSEARRTAEKSLRVWWDTRIGRLAWVVRGARKVA